MIEMKVDDTSGHTGKERMMTTIPTAASDHPLIWHLGKPIKAFSRLDDHNFVVAGESRKE